MVGESGCGKSTVARLLMRLIRPDRGTMVLDGDPVDEPHGITVNELRRQVQMVFQDSYASLNPRLTIVETLAFAPKAHGLPAPKPGRARATCWPRSGSIPTTSPIAIRTSCRAASASGSTSPARWRCGHGW